MTSDRIDSVTLLGSIALIAAVELSTAALSNSFRLSPLFVIGINRLLEIVLLSGIVICLQRDVQSIGLSRATLLPGLKRGLIWSAVFGLLSGFGFTLLYFLDIRPLDLIGTRIPRQPQNIILLFMVGGLIAPVAEEIFFRGILFGFLRRWGAFAAIAISTVVFVFLHPIQGFSLTQLVGGLVFATAYEIEGNLVVPIVIHILGNSAIFSVSLIF